MLTKIVYFYGKHYTFQSKDNYFLEEEHCFTFLQITLMSALVKEDQICISTSAFNPLQYAVLFKHMKKV